MRCTSPATSTTAGGTPSRTSRGSASAGGTVTASSTRHSSAAVPRPARASAATGPSGAGRTTGSPPTATSSGSAATSTNTIGARTARSTATGRRRSGPSSTVSAAPPASAAPGHGGRATAQASSPQGEQRLLPGVAVPPGVGVGQVVEEHGGQAGGRFRRAR
jgi:hypothetical protein